MQIPRFFHRVPVISIYTMAVEEEELCEESKEVKEEKDTGVSAKMAKEIAGAKDVPPEEGT